MPRRIPLAERYQVDPVTGCWNWRGRLSAAGYAAGTVQRMKDGVLRQSVAHRFFYEEARGPVPSGLHLDHLCRNRRCVNPQHLEAVSPRENRRRAARLTDSQVAEIRALRTAGITTAAIAAQFHISPSYASRITTGRRWSN